MTEATYTFPTILDDSYLDPFRESVKSDYNNDKAREILGVGNDRISSFDGKFTGSSSFIQLHLLSMGENKEQLPNKTKPVQIPDLEKAFDQDPNFLLNCYSDIGIAIWSKPETYGLNEVAYENLVNEFKRRNIPLGNGILIYFSGLAKPKEDNNSGYGLVFDLKDIDTNVLEESIKDINEFELYARKENGLARVYRSFRGWDGDYLLAGSGSNGRVVGVGVEAQKN